ncbi:hypothetical protein PM082_001815 [Marasmius tenuissimus]|nr:hypothetical protein PM082_001815 [Marasmius tenuissimus]
MSGKRVCPEQPLWRWTKHAVSYKAGRSAPETTVVPSNQALAKGALHERSKMLRSRCGIQNSLTLGPLPFSSQTFSESNSFYIPSPAASSISGLKASSFTSSTSVSSTFEIILSLYACS